MNWEPWRPDNYPIRDPAHNPWVPLDPQPGGITAYQLWLRLRPIDEDTFRRAISDIRSA